MNRRSLLKAAGWTAGGLTVVSTTGCGLLPPLPTFGASEEQDALHWLKLDAAGQVTFLLPRAELGQGIDHGLTLIVAEELQLDPARIACLYQRTDQMAPCQMTVGSQSIENYAELTAIAAASLRMELLARAATRLAVAPERLRCEQGQIIGPDAALEFLELLQPGEDTVLPATAVERSALRSLGNPERKELTYVGGNAPSLHLDRIVRGAETYSRDVRVANLHFGAVAQPPQIGARLVRCDRASAREIRGVVQVVDGPQGQVGVVATTPMALREGLAALGCEWERLSAEEVAKVDALLDIDTAIEQDLLDHTPINEGRIASGREAAAVHVNVRYDTPMAAHAPLEPRAGVAQPLADGLEVWTGSQDPWYVRSAVSKALGLRTEKVIVHNTRVGGGFGGRVHCQASLEAAWLARAAKVPVKVQWSREDEFRHNYAGPPFSTRIQAGLDAQGRISYWQHQMAGAPVLTSSMLVPPRLHWLANIPADPGTIRGVQIPYTIANHRVESADVRIPMPTGPWRGLGAAPNTFAVECALDELALAADLDPLELRVSHSNDPRLTAVLQRLQQRVGGEKHLGIAATAYKGVTFVAIAVQMAPDTTPLRLKKIWCVHDCGRMVAPDRVRAQVEGNLVWGISMALHERFELNGGIASTDNFDRYAIARITDMPEMDIELVNSQAPSSGAAEAALAPAAAAIANALARQGERVRSLPLARSA